MKRYEHLYVVFSASLCVLYLASGCSPSPKYGVVVQLQTDLVAGEEFDEVRVDLVPMEGGAALLRGAAGVERQPFVPAQRVWEFDAVPEGSYRVELELWRKGSSGSLTETWVLADIHENTSVTSRVTRDCLNVDCGQEQACFQGQCMDPRCSAETPEFCDNGFVCAVDEECGSLNESCAKRVCLEGACWDLSDDASEFACTQESEWCSPELGCLSRGTLEQAPVEVVADASVLWWKSFGGPSEDSGGPIAIDSKGAIYTTGRYATSGAETIEIDGESHSVVTATGVPEYSAYLSSFNSEGELLGTTLFHPDEVAASAVGAHGRALAFDENDNVYLAGTWQGEGFDFGDGPLAEIEGVGVFVASFESDGTLRWSDGYDAGTSSDTAKDLALSAGGMLHVVGRFGAGVSGDTLRFSSGATLTTSDNRFSDGYIADYDRDLGTVVGQRKFSSAEADHGEGISVSDDGSVWVVGRRESGAHVRKYQSDGTLIGSKQFGDDAYLLDLVIDAAGNVYVVGWFDGEIDFDGLSLRSQGERDGFILSLDPDRKVRWVEQLGGSSWETAERIAIRDQQIVVSGRFQNGMDLGQGEVALETSSGLFLGGYDLQGHILWSSALTMTSGMVTGLSFDAAGDILIAGHFDGVATFGTEQSFSANQSQDVFLAKLRLK